jgi:hypothetical protein
MFLILLPRTPTQARLTRNRTDLDHAIGDLRNLLLEQPLDQLGPDPRQDDFHAASDLPDLEDRRPNPLVGVVALAGNLLAPRQDGLRGPQRDRGGGTFHPRHHPGNHLAYLLLELIVDRIPLGLANLLDDHLLGGLRTDTAREFGGVDLGAVMRPSETTVGPVDGDRDLRGLSVLP